MLRAIGYVRVSVSKEDVENQKAAIREYARRKNYDLLTIVEDTVTGVSDPLERPAFRKLLDYAADFDVRVVLAYSLDRIVRGGVAEAFRILSLLRDNNLRVEFVKDEIDLSRPEIFNAYVFAFGQAAELERKMMKARLEAARRAGKRIGRPPYEIPWDEVRKLLAAGLNIKDIYRFLLAKGYLRRKTKDGREVVMSYSRFRQRVKSMLEED